LNGSASISVVQVLQRKRIYRLIIIAASLVSYVVIAECFTRYIAEKFVGNAVVKRKAKPTRKLHQADTRLCNKR
jgi:hypothetical protein